MAKGIVIDEQSVPNGVKQANPLPVRIKNGTTEDDVDLVPVTTPVIYNVVMTSANVTYSQALPANTKRFRLYAIDANKRYQHPDTLKFNFITTGNDWSSVAFIPIPSGGVHEEFGLNLTSKTLYFQSPKGGGYAVIMAWT